MRQCNCDAKKSILIETEEMKFRKNNIAKTDFISRINTFGLKWFRGKYYPFTVIRWRLSNRERITINRKPLQNTIMSIPQPKIYKNVPYIRDTPP